MFASSVRVVFLLLAASVEDVARAEQLKWSQAVKLKLNWERTGVGGQLEILAV